jgi:hypothetical protein
MKYGHCPHCAAEVVSRHGWGKDETDECGRGHRYSAVFTVSREMSDYLEMVRRTLDITRDALLNIMATDVMLTPKRAGTYAARIKRTLNAIPLKTRPEPGAQS